MSQNQEEKGTEDQDEVYERLKASKFKQQKLPAWRPVPTITSTTIKNRKRCNGILSNK